MEALNRENFEDSLLLRCMTFDVGNFQFRFPGRSLSATQLSPHPGPSNHALHVGVDGLDNHGRHGLQSVLWHNTLILVNEPVPIDAYLNESAQHQFAGGSA